MDDIILETDRMVARKMTLEDVEKLLQIFSDPITMHYYTRTFSKEEAHKWIESVLAHYTAYGAGMWMWFLKDTSEFVGQCGLRFQKDIDGKDEVEVGYLFVRKFWNLGLATEAAKASMDYAHTVLGYNRLISLIRPENMPSRRVAEKNGLQIEKEIDYKGLRHYVYAISFDEIL
jgi:RimJ/RimL family protein N-acetyltransferase